MIVDCHGTDLSVPRNDDSELCAWWIAAPHKGARNDGDGKIKNGGGCRSDRTTS